MAGRWVHRALEGQRLPPRTNPEGSPAAPRRGERARACRAQSPTKKRFCSRRIGCWSRQYSIIHGSTFASHPAGSTLRTGSHWIKPHLTVGGSSYACRVPLDQSSVVGFGSALRPCSSVWTRSPDTAPSSPCGHCNSRRAGPGRGSLVNGVQHRHAAKLRPHCAAHAGCPDACGYAFLGDMPALAALGAFFLLLTSHGWTGGETTAPTAWIGAQATTVVFLLQQVAARLTRPGPR